MYGGFKGRPYGIAPAVPNYTGHALILQPPGIYTLYTFPAAGRIWNVGVSYAIATSANVGNITGYTRVLVQGGITLAIVECAISSAAATTPSQDSNTDPVSYYGLPVPSGTVVQLDVNNGATTVGVQQRGSCRLAVSIP
jgi:hypothetical protein